MADTNNVGFIDPSITNPGRSDDSRIIIYGYTPSAALSLLALLLYAIFLVLYIVRLLRPPCLRLHVAAGGVGDGKTISTRPFTILAIATIVFEIVGYAFRIQSASPRSFVGDGADPYKTINFILQYFFIVVAPVFLSGGVYTLLTALMQLSSTNTPHGTNTTATKLCGLTTRAIIAIFVTADVVCTIVQVAGAALIGVRESRRQSPTTANRILLAGLVVQVGSFSGYIVLLVVFLRRCRDSLVGLSRGDAKDARARGGLNGVRILLGRMMGVRTWIVGLVVASLLVYLRTIFRMAETSQGVGGYASSHEVFFGVLEFMPIVLAVGILGFVVPGTVVVEERVRGDDGVENEMIEERVTSKDGR